MKKHLKIIILFALTSFVLVSLIFNGLSEGQFIFIGDQFFRFNYHEAIINSFFIRKPENLNVLNGWQFTTQFWDTLYYLLTYLFQFSFITVEKLQFFITIFITLLFSYIGFRRIFLLFDSKANSLATVAIVAWYSFNPYPVMLWHGGAYNLGSALTYSLAPLILYYFHISIFRRSNLHMKIICALLMAIASFTFWLFAPFALFLIFYSILHLAFNPRYITKFIKNLIVLLLLYLPLISFILFNILYEYFNTAGNNNAVFSATFGNQQGGVWYQVLLLFSWGIYTVWTPRSMYPFHSYYFSKYYIVPTIIMYAVIFYGYIKYYLFTYFSKNKLKLTPDLNRIPVIILLIMFISIFLAKAAQPPFGELFLYLYNNVPFFSVFRTADIRFGFSIVLSIAILMLIGLRMSNKYLFSVIIFLILGFQSFYFFNASAIVGQNIEDKFYDRVLFFQKDYEELINKINIDTSISTQVLPLPAIEYGHYNFAVNEHHFGQDFLSKTSYKPFIYLSQSNGIYTNSYLELKTSIESKELDKLNNFPIKYILLRNDIACADCVNLPANDLEEKYKLILKNDTFELFENNDPTPIVNSPNIKFKIINPVKYKVNFNSVSKNQNLSLLTSFNKDWKIFIEKKTKTNCKKQNSFTDNIIECFSRIRFSEGDEFSYFFRKNLFDSTHKESNGYSNQWTINPDKIKDDFNEKYYTKNDDGSINFDVVIYYLPQSIMNLTLLISIVSGVVMVLYLTKNNNE